jgi:hypothetical protein
MKKIVHLIIIVLILSYALPPAEGTPGLRKAINGCKWLTDELLKKNPEIIKALACKEEIIESIQEGMKSPIPGKVIESLMFAAEGGDPKWIVEIDKLLATCSNPQVKQVAIWARSELPESPINWENLLKIQWTFD